MKKIILLVIFLSTVAFAATTYTTNYNLAKPSDGDANWGEGYRDNLDTIDTELNVNAAGIADHLADTTAHLASNISAVSATVCSSANDVQEFLDCLDFQVNTLSPGGAMDLSSNQTVTGIKTFSTTPVFSALADGVLHITSGNGTIESALINNEDVSASANIEREKLAAGSTNHVLINDGTGVMTSEAQLNASRGGTGVDASTATNGYVLIGNGSGFTLAGITGTADQVSVTNGAGSITLSTPQNIGTTSSPTFSSVTHDVSAIFGDTGGGSNTVTIQAPADASLTSNYTLTLPENDGGANEALITDGSGVLSWGPAGGYPSGSATANITGGGTISISTSLKAQVIYVQGNGGSVTASSTPFSTTNPGDNSEIVVCGRSNTNTVTLQHNDAADGAVLSGNIVLGKYDCITFIYNSTDDRFVEKNRSLK